MIRIRMTEVLLIFLNYLLNRRLERIAPLNTEKPLHSDYHHYEYRDSIVSASTLKTVITMIVPAFLTLIEAVSNTDPHIVRDYMMLNFTVYTLTNFIKLSTSRPRPYCKDAEDKAFKWNQYFESRKSFPSGHACNGFISGIAVARFLVPAFALTGRAALLVQAAVLMFAAIPGITQGICKWHHWTDVAAGYVLAVTYYAAYHQILSYF